MDPLAVAEVNSLVKFWLGGDHVYSHYSPSQGSARITAYVKIHGASMRLEYEYPVDSESDSVEIADRVTRAFAADITELWRVGPDVDIMVNLLRGGSI